MNLFNTENPDPLYIFVLPDEQKNRTIVLRKSSFSPAIFPNISIIDKRIQLHQNHKSPQSIFGVVQPNTNRIQRSKLKDDFDLDTHATNDDEKYVEIVAENVRTEKNFFQFMDKLNKDKIASGGGEGENVAVAPPPSAAAYKQHSLNGEDNVLDFEHGIHQGYRLPLEESSGDSGGYYYQRKKNTKPNNGKVSWQDLGLGGWSGRLSRPAWNFRKGKTYVTP